MDKTSRGLVEFAQMAYKENWGYCLGTFGQILTPALLDQKCGQGDGVGIYNSRYRKYLERFISKRVCDCYGLVKAYVWFHNGEIKYNPYHDINQEMAFNGSTEKGTIDNMPEIPGLVLWMQGHSGIYIGQGEFIECIGAPIGMFKGKIKDGKVEKGSQFTHWFKDNFINYAKPIETLEEAMTIMNRNNIMSNPEYWESAVKSIYHLEELIIRVSNKVDSTKSNHIYDVSQAIKYLTESGVIQNPEYWTKAADVVIYLPELLINFAKKSKM